MKVVGYSSWAPDERANAMRLAFKTLRERTGEPWSLDHFGAADFGDPAALGRLRAAIREADVLIGWQSMTIDTVERLATLLLEMERAGELSRVKILWFDIPDQRLQRLMFSSLGFEFDMTKSNPMKDLSMALKRYQARAKGEEIDAFWEARQGFLGMQKMVGAAPLMAKLLKKPVFKSLVLVGYWNNRSVTNVENLFLYLMTHFMGRSVGPVALPEKVENEGIYHPQHRGLFPDAASYLAWYEPWYRTTFGSTPAQRVGFVTHDLFLPEWNHPVLDALISAWESKGLGVIASMTAVFNAHVVSRGHFLDAKGTPLVDAVYHNVPLYLAGSMFAGSPEASIAFIRDLGSPRVWTSPVNAAMSRADLAASRYGVASLEYIGNVVTPETEGIQPLPPVCSREHGEDVSALVPIADRVELVAEQTSRWLKLRRLRNAEKRLAFFVYDFPPSPANVGVAYFLDVAASLREILFTLRDAGYEVGDAIPADDVTMSKELQAMYAGYRTLGAVSSDEIGAWVRDLPTRHEALFYEVWGRPPATIPVKGLRFGNVTVMLQDFTGMTDMAAIHDKKAPPSPWLLASYRYATRRIGIDAIAHLGTHGLVEWSHGKEWCPAAGDYPEFLLDGAPHVYVFNVLDPVEASIARRRSYATIISHLCPPLRAVEGSEDLRALHRLVHDYYDTHVDNLDRRTALAEEIAGIVQRTGMKIAAPGVLIDVTDERAFVGAVHDELVALEGEFAPAGQHVFGRELSTDDRASTFAACLETGDVDLSRLIAACYGHDYDALLRAPEARGAGGVFNHEIAEELKETAATLVSSDVLRGGPTARTALTGLLRARTVGGRALERDPFADPAFAAHADRARTLWEELGRVGAGERAGLLRALDGGYLEPSAGGELIGDWSILPTGRNMASTDVRMLPREAAVRKARATVAQILDAATAERGHVPETVGVVLWGSEVLESEGVGIAQALDFLGARIAKDRFGRAERVELISLDELGRPRVDIVASASTVFKNTFPGAIRLLHDAAALAAAADEPYEFNPIRRHTDELLAQGVPPHLAVARVFGMVDDAFMGQVGAMLESGRYDDYRDIGSAWMSDNGNAMIPTYAQIVIHPAPAVHRHLIASVEIIQQPLVQMAAGGPVKEDMFASFTSAFGAAKRAMGHEDTMIVVSDLTKRQPTVRNFRNVVVNGVLTRYHSRAWRDRVLEHGYSGVMEFGDVLKAMRSTEAALGDTISPDLWERTVEVTLGEWERIAEANPHKTREMGEVLLDTRRRGMWENAELEAALKEKLNDLDADVEIATYRAGVTAST